MAEPLPPISPAQIVTLRAMAMTLTKVSLAVVAIGVVACVDALCRAFFGTAEGVVGWIPFANSVLSRPIHKIEQKVSNFLGGLEEHIDANVGFYIHALAINVGRLADGSAEAGWTLWLLGKALGATRAAIHALPSTGSVVNKITHVTKIERVIVNKVTTVGKIAAHAAPGLTAQALRAVAGTLEHVIEWDLPSIRARERAIADRLGKLARRIRSEAKPLAGLAAVALVAAALRRIGLNWIRCSNVKKAGRRICGMDASLLESLLADTVAIAGAISIVELAHELQGVMPEIMGAVRLGIREAHAADVKIKAIA